MRLSAISNNDIMAARHPFVLAKAGRKRVTWNQLMQQLDKKYNVKSLADDMLIHALHDRICTACLPQNMNVEYGFGDAGKNLIFYIRSNKLNIYRASPCRVYYVTQKANGDLDKIFSTDPNKLDNAVIRLSLTCSREMGPLIKVAEDQEAQACPL